MSAPQVAEEPMVVFSGNFEYHPNIDAVDFLVNSIWPEVRKSALNCGCVWWDAARGLSGICCLPDSRLK